MVRSVLYSLCVGFCLCSCFPTRGSDVSSNTASLSVVRSSPYTVFKDIKVDGHLLTEKGAPLPTNVPIAAGAREIELTVELRVGEQCRTVQLICPSAVVESVCSGRFQAEPGVLYALSADAVGGEVQAVVREARQLSNALSVRPLESTRLTCRRVRTEPVSAAGELHQ